MKRDTSRPQSLAGRLLIGQLAVLVAGALTTGLVATLLGPRIFHQHLIQAGHTEHAPELAHIEMAYRDASLISVGLGLLVSIVAAGLVTWFMTQRLRQPLKIVSAAATDLAHGHYAARALGVRSHTELDSFAAAFNTMAERLQGTEDTRRRMLADLAHEMRTPIMTLAAYHDGLFDGVAALDEQTRTVLTEQTHRLTRLAKDIKDVSAADEGQLHLHLSDQPVNDVIWAAHDNHRESFAAHGVNLVLDDDGGAGVVVRVDRQRMAQVLSNLLTNALRHTPDGGTVVISTQARDREVAIVVTDNGDGITTEQIRHVFERFYRGDSSRTRDREGSGIGLTVSKAIVDAHGGSLSAHSDGIGRGAAFTVLLTSVDQGRSH